MPVTLCDLASKLPLLIGKMLDREAFMKKGRFREETMTDILTGALAAFAGPNLVIEYPDETRTGSDLDLRFWNVASGTDLHVRIQAKRLNAEVDGTRQVKVLHRSYRELLHKPPTATTHQFETLRNAPRPWVPLYMFYNHQHVVDDAAFSGAMPQVSGVNLAFASRIAAELDDKLVAAAATPKKVKHHKRLSYLRKHFFGLDAILCPGSGIESDVVPSPRAVATSLLERYRAPTKVRPTEDDDDAVLRILRGEGRSIADGDARRLPDGPAIRVDRSIESPTITFISGRTVDDRTPRITLDAR